MNRFEKIIRHYIDAGFPILYIHTYEVEKAKGAILGATEGIRNVEVPAWDGTDRACDLHSGKPLFQTKKRGGLEYLLDERMKQDTWDWDDSLNNKAIYQAVVLENVTWFKDRPAITARLKKFAERICSGVLDATIFIVSPILWITPELEQYITVLELENPEEDEIRDILEKFCASRRIGISEALTEEFVTAFKGMSEFEIEHTLQWAASQRGDLNKGHIELIFQQKCQILKKRGILELTSQDVNFEEIGGLTVLKNWLQRKAGILSRWPEAKDFGIDMPKGVLLAGMPGCGKSLTAKATAKLFKVPLVRLDLGRLLGKYQGQSEANMRKAIKLAEMISPCVLWIDEMEKAFAGTGGENKGGEVAIRLLGCFLTWLQEKKSTVFVVATANDIRKLPPELLRKGRFDEIFYVGLPMPEERRRIFQHHIQTRRACDLKKKGPDGKLLIDLDQLARETEGYSGADIEAIVRESIEIVFEKGRDSLTTQDISEQIHATQSLSKVMGKEIQELLVFYEKKRFRNASEKGKK